MRCSKRYMLTLKVINGRIEILTECEYCPFKNECDKQCEKIYCG